MNPFVELVTTGAELLDGRVVNRHAAWLGAQLESIGWRLLRDTTVPDDETMIRDALLGAISRCDVVLMTGGLGPTTDDVSREVASVWAGSRVILHEPTRCEVVERYRSRNKPLNDTVERHALVVEGAEVLANHHGLAPGEHIEVRGRHLFLLPGPPREFQGVMRDHVLPWMVRQGVAPNRRHAMFQTVGLGESDIASLLARHGFDGARIDLAYCAEPARVVLRIGEQVGCADAFDAAVALVRKVLADDIYAEGEDRIEQVVGRILTEGGLTLAVAESCTGGLLGERLTSVPGSSAFFRGGVMAYHNDLKESLLGVPRGMLDQHGAVSEQVARAMAEGVRRIAGADYGVAITGIAGPSGGTPEKPVGLVYVACAGSRGAEVQALRLGGGREFIRASAATMAMDLLRRCLRGGSRVA